MQQRQAQTDPAPRRGRRSPKALGSPPCPAAMPTTEPLASRISMRPSAAERICFACAPSATRILSSRSRLLTVYEARPNVPAIESSNPKAPKRPRATVATWDRKETQCKLAVPGARFPNRNGAVEIADHLRMVATISAVSRRVRTISAVLVFAFCEIGKKAAASRIFAQRKVFSIGHRCPRSGSTHRRGS